MHAGVLDHHQSLWEAGLQAFVQKLEQRRLRGVGVPEELLFVGLSMGGVLALTLASEGRTDAVAALDIRPRA